MASISPVLGAVAITPFDSATFQPGRGLYVGNSGTIRVQCKDGSIVFLNNIVTGIIHPICVIRVYATGTTASNIVICY